jgi:hypothetical protein
MSLGGELKTTLQAAMKSGGPLQAVSVCNTEAPAIAAQVSTERSMQVGRTSLKTRNPGNAPDVWETAVLERFEERKAAGEPIASLEYSELTTQEGARVFRYMKAIPVEGVCLACHGPALSDELAARVDELYPEDRARGYDVGDIRGAFTVSRRLD